MFVVNLALSDFCMMLTQAWPVIINAFRQRFWMWGNLGRSFIQALLSLVELINEELSYATKNQHPKSPTRDVSCLSLVLYGIRICGFHAGKDFIIGAL